MTLQNNTFSFLLCCTGLANLGHCTAYALLAIYLLHSKQISGGAISIILLYFAIALRGSRIFFGPVLDLLSTRSAMLISMCLCASGYFVLAYTKTLWIIFVALLLIGIGYGTVNLIIRSISSLLKNNTVLANYAALNMVTNLAAAIGPCVGNLLMIKYPHYGLCLFSAAIFIAATLVIWIFPLQEKYIISNKSWFSSIRHEFCSSKIRLILWITILAWFLLAQLFSLIPLYVAKTFGLELLLSTVYLLNSMIIVIFSLPVNNWLIKKAVSLGWQLIISFLMLFIGFLIMAWTQSLINLYVTITLWSFAEVLITPAINTLIVKNTHPNIRLISFTVNSIAMGIGEGIGNFVGIVLANSSQWQFSFSLLATIALIALLWVIKKLFNAPREGEPS